MSDQQQQEPQDWESALIAAGFIDGRGANKASWRRLAQAVGVHQSTLAYMRNGDRDTDQKTVDAVADALRMDPRTVAEWVGRARSQRKPFQPHEDANLLTREEQLAVNRIIALLAEPKKQGGSHEGRRPKAQKITGRDEGDGNAQPEGANGPPVAEVSEVPSSVKPSTMRVMRAEGVSEATHARLIAEHEEALQSLIEQAAKRARTDRS